MLEVTGLSLKVCIQEGAFGVAKGVGADDAVLDGSGAAEHPHEVIEVVRGHSLVQTHAKLKSKDYSVLHACKLS